MLTRFQGRAGCTPLIVHAQMFEIFRGFHVRKHCFPFVYVPEKHCGKQRLCNIVSRLRGLYGTSVKPILEEYWLAMGRNASRFKDLSIMQYS